MILKILNLYVKLLFVIEHPEFLILKAATEKIKEIQRHYDYVINCLQEDY